MIVAHDVKITQGHFEGRNGIWLHSMRNGDAIVRMSETYSVIVSPSHFDVTGIHNYAPSVEPFRKPHRKNQEKALVSGVFA